MGLDDELRARDAERSAWIDQRESDRRAAVAQITGVINQLVPELFDVCKRRNKPFDWPRGEPKRSGGLFKRATARPPSGWLFNVHDETPGESGGYNVATIHLLETGQWYFVSVRRGGAGSYISEVEPAKPEDLLSTTPNAFVTLAGLTKGLMGQIA
jgi:hypothetical protein